MCPAFESEKDLQNLLWMTTALGNLCYKNEDAFELLKAMDVTFPNLESLVGANQPQEGAKTKQQI
jgi:hypothetical protein